MDPKLYKAYHESLMQNNNGTSAMEIWLSIVPSFFTTFHVMNVIAVANIVRWQSRFCVEFLFVVVSIVLTVTVLHNRLLEINVALLVVTVLSAAFQTAGKTHVASFVQIQCQRPAYITVVRSVISLITAVCILAVDFAVFPRRFAKTETFGFGLMDVGVGLFIFSNGIISPDVHAKNYGKKFSVASVWRSVVSCTPLLLLGVSRFFAVNQIDYQQHYSEYGVHWNFFITLATTKVFGTLATSVLTHPRQTRLAAIVIATGHELFLQLGLSAYVMSEGTGRDTFVSANREGLVSIPGYVALYMGSIYIGHMLRPTDESQEFAKPREVLQKVLRLAIVAAVLWKMVFVSQEMFGVSRRLANMGYTCWTLAIGASMVALFMFGEVIHRIIAFDKHKGGSDEKDSIAPLPHIPIIYEAINFNGLVFFLGANLLTGLVNILFQTMLLGQFESLLIIVVYAFVVCSVISILYIHKIRIKYW